MDTEDLKIALLIDSDNISPKYMDTLFDELKSVGVVTIKRIYGDWTRDNAKCWKSVLPDYALTPMQQYAYTTGKNSTDSAMIIDAMDLLYREPLDVFCLATSDSDFTRLAARLRESGKQVIGMGEQKTPKAFINACNSFRFLDVLSGETEKESDETAQSSITPKKEIEQEILLLKKQPDFDPRNYGFSKFSGFLKSFASIGVVAVGKNGVLFVAQKPSAKRSEIEKYVRSLLENAKGKRMNIGEINTRLTEHIKDFSVKSLGYKQIKLFLSDIDGVEIENCDCILK